MCQQNANLWIDKGERERVSLREYIGNIALSEYYIVQSDEWMDGRGVLPFMVDPPVLGASLRMVVDVRCVRLLQRRWIGQGSVPEFVLFKHGKDRQGYNKMICTR